MYLQSGSSDKKLSPRRTYQNHSNRGRNRFLNAEISVSPTQNKMPSSDKDIVPVGRRHFVFFISPFVFFTCPDTSRSPGQAAAAFPGSALPFRLHRPALPIQNQPAPHKKDTPQRLPVFSHSGLPAACRSSGRFPDWDCSRQMPLSFPQNYARPGTRSLISQQISAFSVWNPPNHTGFSAT